MKQVFVAATRQNDGKTMVSLGLFHEFRRLFPDIGYMKPVGQQYQVIDHQKIDKDAVLFQSVYGLTDPFVQMSPLAIPRGFTQSVIEGSMKENLSDRIESAYRTLSQDRSFLLLEGTGHAGVGSVFGLSNAQVAKLLGAKVILVSLGGVGRAIDEIMLNKAVFDLLGVELLGVIINKTRGDKYDKVSDLIRSGLSQQGIDVFGVIPFVDMLIRPSVASLFEAIPGDILSGDKGYHRVVDKCVIGDMVPHDALDQLGKNSLLIVPANREGLIMSAVCGNLVDVGFENQVSAIIFTGGRKPHQKVLDLIQKTSIPLMVVPEDSFSVATKITNMLVKVRSDEPDKITKIQSLMKEYVDVDQILDRL